MEEKTVVIEQQTDVVKVITTETENLGLEEARMISEEEGKSKPIVVTGFGKLDQWSPNFSEALMKEFYKVHGGKFQYNTDGKREEIVIETGPWSTPTAIEVRYSDVKGEKFDCWLKSSDARLYVHLGETTTQAFDEDGRQLLYRLFLEQQAVNCPGKDPESDCPCNCDWTRDPSRDNNGGKKCEKDGPDILKTSFDISSLIENVGVELVRDSGKDPVDITLIKSRDAGKYLCNFLYYRSLYYAKKLRSSANVLFIHVPHFKDEEKASKVYVSVLNKIIKRLLDMETAPSQTTPQEEQIVSLRINSIPVKIDYSLSSRQDEVLYTDARMPLHTKKQARESRKRRRQKRNARQRNRK